NHSCILVFMYSLDRVSKELVQTCTLTKHSCQDSVLDSAYINSQLSGGVVVGKFCIEVRVHFLGNQISRGMKSFELPELIFFLWILMIASEDLVVKNVLRGYALSFCGQA